MDRREMLFGIGAGIAGIAGANALAAADPAKLAAAKECCTTCTTIAAKCLAECLACFAHCTEHALKGHKEHAACAQECLDCSEFCKVCLTICSRGGPMQPICCEACAKACEECAKACEKFPDDKVMAACAKTCRECAKACKECCKH